VFLDLFRAKHPDLESAENSRED